MIQSNLQQVSFAPVGKSPAKKQKVNNSKKPKSKVKSVRKQETVPTDDVDVTRSFAGTLVVVPPTLVQQWVHEMRMHANIKVEV